MIEWFSYKEMSEGGGICVRNFTDQILQDAPVTAINSFHELKSSTKNARLDVWIEGTTYSESLVLVFLTNTNRNKISYNKTPEYIFSISSISVRIDFIFGEII